MSEPRLDPGEQQVEQTLGRLHPIAPTRASAALVLLEADRRRQRIQLWTWRAVAAVLALALAIQFSLGRRPTAPTLPPLPGGLATVTPPATHFDLPPTILPVTGDNYISNRNRMIAFEVHPPRPPVTEALPPPAKLERRPTAPGIRPAPSFLELLFTNSDSVQS
jgi:hypothetical protein